MRHNGWNRLRIVIMLALTFLGPTLSSCGGGGGGGGDAGSPPGGGGGAVGAAEPAGVYVLGVAGSGTGALLDEYNKAIAAETTSGEDRFTGYVLRVLLDDLITNDTDSSGAIQYDFSPIINSLTTIQQETGGVRPAGTRDPVTLQILTRNAPPPIVMAQIPDTEEYTRVTNGVSEQIPVPWSPAAVTVLLGLYTALANATITDYPQVLHAD